MLLIIILFVNGVSFVYSQQEISKERKENRFLEIEVDNPELQKEINALRLMYESDLEIFIKKNKEEKNHCVINIKRS
jgi:hypothetical protein